MRLYTFVVCVLLKRALLEEHKINASQGIPTALFSITFSCIVIVYLYLAFYLKFLEDNTEY